MLVRDSPLANGFEPPAFLFARGVDPATASSALVANDAASADIAVTRPVTLSSRERDVFFIFSEDDLLRSSTTFSPPASFSPISRTMLPSQHPCNIFARLSFRAATCFAPSCAARCAATNATASPPRNSALTMSPPLFPMALNTPVAWYPTRTSRTRSATGSAARTMRRIWRRTAVWTTRYPGPTAALTTSNQWFRTFISSATLALE